MTYTNKATNISSLLGDQLSSRFPCASQAAEREQMLWAMSLVVQRYRPLDPQIAYLEVDQLSKLEARR